MSSKRFEDLQDDLNLLLKELKHKLDIAQKAFGEDKRIQYRNVQRQLDEVQTLLTELETESITAPHPFRQVMTTQIKQYQSELSRINKEISSLTKENNRQQLFATGTPVLGNPNPASNRSRLFQMNDTLQRTSDGISRTMQLAAETDQIGTEVIEELGTQRETLIRTRERLMDTEDNLKTSRRILRTMYRRVITNKLILIVIIILELAIMGGVVYYKFFSHKSK